jgi:hypothetical protein
MFNTLGQYVNGRGNRRSRVQVSPYTILANKITKQNTKHIEYPNPLFENTNGISSTRPSPFERNVLRNRNKYYKEQLRLTGLTGTSMAKQIIKLNNFIKNHENRLAAKIREEREDYEKFLKRQQLKKEQRNNAIRAHNAKIKAEKNAENKRIKNERVAKVELYRALANYMVRQPPGTYKPAAMPNLHRIAASKTLSNKNAKYLSAAVENLSPNEANKIVNIFRTSRLGTGFGYAF